jgi:hypothetical protein
MTLDLSAIEARVNAATPGPWTVDQMDMYIHAADGFMVASNCPVNEGWQVRGAGAESSGKRPAGSQDANAAFIAAARSDVPTLIAEVRRLRGKVGAETNATPMTYESVRAMVDRHDGEETYNGSTLCALRILRDEIERLKRCLREEMAANSAAYDRLILVRRIAVSLRPERLDERREELGANGHMMLTLVCEELEKALGDK